MASQLPKSLSKCVIIQTKTNLDHVFDGKTETQFVNEELAVLLREAGVAVESQSHKFKAKAHPELVLSLLMDHGFRNIVVSESVNESGLRCRTTLTITK